MTWHRAVLSLILILSGPIPAAAQSTPLDEYLRIRQSIASTADGAARATFEQQAAAAREALLASARRSSRLLVMTDRRGDHETAPAQESARLVARNGRVTLQALGGPRPQSPSWERAGEVEPDAYLAMLRRLLDDPALVADWPTPRFDPNLAGPRRAVVVHLVIDEAEREMQALGGVPYERLAAMAGVLLEFCRSVPLRPLP